MTKNNSTKKSLTVGQCCLMAGIMIIISLILAPLGLIKAVNKEIWQLICYCLEGIISLLVIYFIRRKITKKTSLNIQYPSLKIIPFVMTGTVAITIGIVFPFSDLIPMPEIVAEAFKEAIGHTSIYTFILMVIVAPVLEELAFRGIMLDGMLSKYSPLKSILISSILFGIVHLNPWQFIDGFIVGIFIGWIYYKTQNVSFAIIVHASVNAIGYICNFFPGYNTTVELFGGLRNYILVILSSLFILTVCVFILKKLFDEKEKIASK
jgi:membrane protease YdiL (CAAX protease family)